MATFAEQWARREFSINADGQSATRVFSVRAATKSEAESHPSLPPVGQEHELTPALHAQKPRAVRFRSGVWDVTVAYT